MRGRLDRSESSPGMSSVRKKPGAMALTVMLCGANSHAQPRVSCGMVVSQKLVYRDFDRRRGDARNPYLS